MVVVIGLGVDIDEITPTEVDGEIAAELLRIGGKGAEKYIDDKKGSDDNGGVEDVAIFPAPGAARL